MFSGFATESTAAAEMVEMNKRAKKIWQAHLKALKKKRERIRSMDGQHNAFTCLWGLNRRIYNISHLLMKAETCGTAVESV